MSCEKGEVSVGTRAAQRYSLTSVDKIGVMGLSLLVVVRNLAAKFWTNWSLFFFILLEHPDRKALQ